MNITDDYSISKLFYKKEIKILIDNKYGFTLKVFPIKEFYDNNTWNAFYHFITMTEEQWKEIINIDGNLENFEIIMMVLFNLSQFKQFKEIGTLIQNGIKMICNESSIDWKNKIIIFENVTMTSEIWNYIIYLLKLSCGEKANQPLSFESPEVRQMFLKQQKLQEKIDKIKNKGKTNDKEALIKNMLYITYAFPSLTFDYLFNQTMAQIRWLQEMAAGATSYSFNEKVFAAGNVKKGAKLKFFIE